MDISAIALQGLQQAETQLDQTAKNIASGSASPSDLVALMTAQNQASVNLDVLKTTNEVQKSLIDIMA
jgi:hypothetical protein